jgi:hypothetical protein
MDKRVIINLPPELLARAKRMAGSEGRTLSALVEEGLRFILDNRQNHRKRQRRPLPVSKASGGLQPGITRFSDVQDMDDCEYVERMKYFK